MAWCDRGVQTLLATVGAFAAFSLMTIAIGTDYWLYSRAYICNSTNATADETQTQPKTKKGDLTHSGLWRICCIEGKIARMYQSLETHTGDFCNITHIFRILSDARAARLCSLSAHGDLSAQRNLHPLPSAAVSLGVVRFTTRKDRTPVEQIKEVISLDKKHVHSVPLKLRTAGKKHTADVRMSAKLQQSANCYMALFTHRRSQQTRLRSGLHRCQDGASESIHF